MSAVGHLGDLFTARAASVWRDVLARGPRIDPPTLAVAAVTLAIAVQVAMFCIALRPGAGSAPVAAAGVAPRGVDYTGLLNGHLFGTAPTTGEPQADSSHAFDLTGTIAYPRPEDGYAILREPGHGGGAYRAGAELPGGSVLYQVYADHVVVQRDGGLYTILLPHADLAGLLAQNVVAQAAARPRDLILERARKLPDRKNDVIAFNEIRVKPTPLTQKLGAKSVTLANHLLGYTVGAVGNKSVIPGLPPRVIITAINGISLTDGNVASQMFNSLASGGEAAFTIQDGDEQRTVMLNVAAVNSMANAARKSH